MSDFLKMDVFFVVATLAVLVVGVLSTIVLIRVWRILGNFERVSENVADETDSLRADIEELRVKIKSAMGLGYFAGLVSSFFGKKRNSRKKQ